MPEKRKKPTPKQRGDIGWIKKQKALAASRKRAKKRSA